MIRHLSVKTSLIVRSPLCGSISDDLGASHAARFCVV